MGSGSASSSELSLLGRFRLSRGGDGGIPSNGFMVYIGDDLNDERMGIEKEKRWIVSRMRRNEVEGSSGE
jgi:hypothetical protein